MSSASSLSSTASSAPPVRSKVFHSGELWMQHQMLSGEEIEPVEAMGSGMIVNQINNLDRLGFMESASFAFISVLSVEGEVWCGMVCALVSDSNSVSLFTAFPAQTGPGLLKVIRREDAASILELHHQSFFAADPISQALNSATRNHEDIFVGVTVLNYSQRRRLRINGRLLTHNNGTLANGRTVHQIEVDQSYGNCPKYIPARAFQFRSASEMNTARTSASIVEGLQWTPMHEKIVREADSFFLGSVYSGNARASHRQQIGITSHSASTARSLGCDCSHRGGFPGFLSVCYSAADPSSPRLPLLVFGDYAGNRMYQSLGNVIGDGRVGLFIPHFASCSAMYISGEASVVFSEAEARKEFGVSKGQFPSSVHLAGAECLIVVRVRKCVLAEDVLPVKSQLLSYSPFNPGNAEAMKNQTKLHADNAEQSEESEAVQLPHGHCKVVQCTSVESSSEAVRSSPSSESSSPIAVEVSPPSGSAFTLSIFAIRKETADINTFLMLSSWVPLSAFRTAGYHECLPGDYAVFEFLVRQQPTLSQNEVNWRKETRCWTLTMLPTVLYVRVGSTESELECRFALSITVKRQVPVSSSKLSLSCYLHDKLTIASPMRLAAIQRTEGFSPFQSFRVAASNPQSLMALQAALNKIVVGLPAVDSLPSWLDEKEGSKESSTASDELQAALISNLFQHAAHLHREINEKVQQNFFTDHSGEKAQEITSVALSQPYEPLIFLCSGIGITPFFNIIQHLICYAGSTSFSSSSNCASGASATSCYSGALPILFIISIHQKSDLSFSDWLAFDSLLKAMESCSQSFSLRVEFAVSHGEAQLSAKFRENATRTLSTGFHVGRLNDKALAESFGQWLKTVTETKHLCAQSQRTSAAVASAQSAAITPVSSCVSNYKRCHFFLCGSTSYQGAMQSAINSDSLLALIRNALGASVQIVVHEEDFSY